MKFILNESKFILNENYSFTLDERFILDESLLLEAGATVAHLRENIKRLAAQLPQILTALPIGLELKLLDNTPLKGEKVDIEDTIKEGCKAIQDLLVTKKDFKKLLDKMMSRVKSEKNSYSRQELIIIEPLCDIISGGIDSVTQTLKNLKRNSAAEMANSIVKLEKSLPALKTNIEKLFGQFEQPTTEPEEPNEEKKYTYSLTNTAITLKVGDTYELGSLIKVEPEKKEVKLAFEVTKPSTATITDKIKGILKALAEGETDIKITADGNEFICKAIVEKTEEKEPDQKPVTNTENWAELYEKCKGRPTTKEAYDKFWHGGLPTDAKEAETKNLPVASAKQAEGYFKAEWGKNAELVKSLGSYFIHSLLDPEMGWTAVLNPYVALLQHLFKLENSSITKEAFDAIYAAYKQDGSLSENDLKGKGKLGELNLVRNSKLYAMPGAKIREYLKWQREAKNSSEVPSDSNIKTMFANIVVNSETVADLKDEQAFNKAYKANFQYEIRDLTKYKELIQTYLKVDGDKEDIKQATDEEVTKILAEVTAADKAKKLLTYLVNLYRIKNLTLLTKFFEKPFGQKLKSNRERVITSFEEDKEFDKLLNISTRKYSEKQLEELITKLIETAGL